MLLATGLVREFPNPTYQSAWGLDLTVKNWNQLDLFQQMLITWLLRTRHFQVWWARCGHCWRSWAHDGQCTMLWEYLRQHAIEERRFGSWRVKTSMYKEFMWESEELVTILEEEGCCLRVGSKTEPGEDIFSTFSSSLSGFTGARLPLPSAF